MPKSINGKRVVKEKIVKRQKKRQDRGPALLFAIMV